MNKIQIKKLLDENLCLLFKSLDVLTYSLNNCKKIGIKNNYNMQELSEFESLSSRFARSSDILTQKVLKTLFIYMQEEAKFFIDRCNLSEKIGLVENSDDLYHIRKLRNDISHEYCIDDITEIFAPLLTYSDLLVTIINRTNKYIKTW